jgi:hypothetical protein
MDGSLVLWFPLELDLNDLDPTWPTYTLSIQSGFGADDCLKLVLDPMAGAGTTPKMALLNHRRYLGCEPWNKAFAIAKRRMRDAHTLLTDLCLEIGR